MFHVLKVSENLITGQGPGARGGCCLAVSSKQLFGLSTAEWQTTPQTVRLKTTNAHLFAILCQEFGQGSAWHLFPGSVRIWPGSRHWNQMVPVLAVTSEGKLLVGDLPLPPHYASSGRLTRWPDPTRRFQGEPRQKPDHCTASFYHILLAFFFFFF